MSPRILFIDESPDLLANLRTLAGQRFEVVEAADEEAAIRLLGAREPFAAILCEPSRAEGLLLLDHVHRAAPRTPIVVLTDSRDPELLAEVHAVAEPWRMALKPVEAPHLVELLDSAVERDRALREAREVEEELLFAHDSLRELTAGLEARLMEQVEGLRTLHRFSIEINASDSLEAIAGLAARAAYELLGGHAVHVQIWDDESEQRVVYADVGPEMSTRMHREMLRTSQGVVGEIVVDRNGPRGSRLGEGALANLALVAGPTAVAVANVLRSRERDQAQQATILALARLAEQRDNETGKHIERVSRYCELVARALRDRGLHTEEVTDRFIDHLVRSAPLHDIGKVGIPDSILLKPGKLSPGEWEVMKTHASIGEQTLQEVIASTRCPGYLEMGRDIAGGHHERWDGTGYPRGLAGQAIPLSARILALADIYDALTTRRPYKKPWSHEEAIEHLAGLAGNHLDPDVVAVFLEEAEEADRIRTELADEPEAEAALDGPGAVRVLAS